MHPCNEVHTSSPPLRLGPLRSPETFPRGSLENGRQGTWRAHTHTINPGSLYRSHTHTQSLLTQKRAHAISPHTHTQRPREEAIGSSPSAHKEVEASNLPAGASQLLPEGSEVGLDEALVRQPHCGSCEVWVAGGGGEKCCVICSPGRAGVREYSGTSE